MPFGLTACPSHNRKIPDNKIAFRVPQTVSENVALHDTNPIEI